MRNGLKLSYFIFVDIVGVRRNENGKSKANFTEEFLGHNQQIENYYVIG